MFAAYTWPPKEQALQMNYVISCSARTSRNTKCFYQWLIVNFIIWSNQTTKHLGGVMLLKISKILDQWRVMVDKGQGASHTTDNHKSTDTCESSWADDMQVQDVWQQAKLLLQQHRTCLHQRVLLHAWQKVKDVGTPMVWPVSVTQKKKMKRVPWRRTVK